MKIGETIRRYRKEKDMTQEQLADRLGVTASAVNKWERGSACPDIALLAPIARVLGISLDTLLAYREELTEEEVNELLARLRERLEKEPYQDAFAWAQDKIRTFPNSESLMVQAAVVLSSYRIVKGVSDAAQYDTQIIEWQERALESEDEKLRTMAADALYTFCLSREEYGKAQEYLQYFSEQNPDRQYRQALLYSRRGQVEEAYEAYEKLLFQMYNRALMICNGICLLDMQERDFERAHYMADKMTQLAGAFDMGKYQAAGGRFMLAVEERDPDACAASAQEMLAGVQEICGYTQSPLYSHMTFPYRESAEQYTGRLREALLKYLRDEETFAFMAGNERWKRMLAGEVFPPDGN